MVECLYSLVPACSAVAALVRQPPCVRMHPHMRMHAHLPMYRGMHVLCLVGVWVYVCCPACEILVPLRERRAACIISKEHTDQQFFGGERGGGVEICLSWSYQGLLFSYLLALLPSSRCPQREMEKARKRNVSLPFFLPRVTIDLVSLSLYLARVCI